ncbi:hypothetical protein M1770_01415 [Spiroplasma citri]|uniref:hypothetical protein n=1 Tax=Spiroplasma citri TaxID=2133 RepID=UPI0024126211|nr:hypothetical protein [Spiroplasma citri]WFG98659.1 hypothetical protein M1770_01415 [Spiroplasma citri]
MDMKFWTTKEYKKIKRDFIIRNFAFGFCYFFFFISFIMCIVCFIISINFEVEIILVILFPFLLLILSVWNLFDLIMEHISEIKRFKVTVLKKQIEELEGKMLRGLRVEVDKIE